MAETLLTVTNRVLKAVKIIAGEDGELASLTDSARQVYIDLAVSKVNQVVRELYGLLDESAAQEVSTGNITLATDTREYTLPTDLVQIRWPLINETNGQIIREYPGGFDQMRVDQVIPSQYTGRLIFAVISSVNGKLRVDHAPTSSENGDVYVCTYDKSLTISTAAATFPFHDDVIIAGVDAVAELWRQSQRGESDPVAFNIALGQAANLLSQKPRRREY